ncbi:MAG: prepilin-type cleavage/methylation domain-containing protein [Pseudanabaena frigida]|uniref:Prepilin-type cleavage/methylation domain-containing protein n=1 Tax=Pseudanabaena frigida TaxID=945775 RepID=A0A2W4WCD2_9CYAN|nr:MAG: prepilin-type cleavage/methylation domain-containing protein [Pseudanabaena frigida]
MKSEFKTKLVQHIIGKKSSEEGFTLIELLVVIIIIGILAAIALPSFLNQASKARQSEAKSYTGAMNRAQQAYYLEKQEFAPNLVTLSFNIAQTTANYGYGISRTASKTTGTGTQVSVGNFGVANATATGGTGTNPDTIVGSTSSNLKSYIGAVSVSPPSGSIEASALACLCEANLSAVNAGSIANSTNNASTYVTLSTAASPVCRTGAGGTYYSPVQ